MSANTHVFTPKVEIIPAEQMDAIAAGKPYNPPNKELECAPHKLYDDDEAANTSVLMGASQTTEVVNLDESIKPQ